MWNLIGTREPSRSSMSFTPESELTMSGTCTIMRPSSSQRPASMCRLTSKIAACVSRGPSKDR